MVSLLSRLMDGFPPLVKEGILLVLGILFIAAGLKGGSLREMAFGLAK